MRNKNPYIFLFLILMLFSFWGRAQTKVTYEANNLPLSTILNAVSSKYPIRFAYNEDLFSQIQTTVSYQQTPVDLFLNDLCTRFGLRYKLIGGTYVIYVDDEIKVKDAIQTTISRNNAQMQRKEVVLPTNLSPEFKLNGIVKNEKTGDKINLCGLKINEVLDVITNEMGFFSILMIPEEQIHIQINNLGFHPLDTIIYTLSTDPIELSLIPIEFIEPMKNIGFRHIKFMVSMPEVPDIIVFNPKSTLQVPALESNDLMNALTIIPGINNLKGTETGLSIRGGAPSDNLVLIDGIPIIESSHLMGNLSILNAKYIQQAFVSRGGFGAEYGGRTSGIVDLTGKSGNNDVAVVDFTANLLHTNIYVGLPITEKSSLSGSFKKSFVDVWSDFLIRNFALENKTINADNLIADADVDKTVINYTDANLKLSIRPTNRDEITVNYFSSFDSQQRDYGFQIQENYKELNNSKSNSSGYSFNYKTQNKGWMNTFTVGYNHMESSSTIEYTKDAKVKDQLVKPYFDAEQIQLQELSTNWKSQVNGKKFIHQFGVGFNLNQIQNKYEDYEIKIIAANNFNDSISSLSSVSVANSYYQIKFFPVKWLSIRWGVRGLYQNNNKQFNFQPRYGIELNPNQKLKFHYSGGRYLQQLYLAYRIDSYHNISPIWFIPQASQKSLDAFHHIVGTRLELNNLLFNVEAYQKINRNKTFYIGNEAIKDGLRSFDYQQQMGEELNRGIDLFFQCQTSIFKHLVSYSLSQSFEKLDVINNNQYFPSMDHQLHRLRLTEIVNLGSWTASVNWYFASGSPFLMNNSTSTQLNFGYHPNNFQTDVALVKQFRFNNFFADLGFTILNVSNRKNEIALKNLVIPEGSSSHSVSTTTISTAFSPLFYINLRYE